MTTKRKPSPPENEPNIVPAEVLDTVPAEAGAHESGDAPINRMAALSGVRAMAALSDADYGARMNEMRTALARLREIHHTLLEEGVDYEKLDWAPKPILKQSGAIQIIRFFGFAWSFLERETLDDGHKTFAVTCRLHLGGSQDGPIFGEWTASASTLESKYRYRTANRVCPDCTKDTTLRKSKRDPEFYCWDKLGGCGATFKLNDPRITDQVLGKIENQDIADEESTVRHMAQKRALVGVVRIATGADRYFEHPDVADREDRMPRKQQAQDSNRGQAAPQSRNQPTAAMPPAPRADDVNDLPWERGEPKPALTDKGKPTPAGVKAAMDFGAPPKPATPTIEQWNEWLAQNIAAGMVEELAGTQLRILLSNKSIQEGEIIAAKNYILAGKDKQKCVTNMVERLKQIAAERDAVETDKDLVDAVPDRRTHSQARPVRKYPKMSGGTR